MNIILAGDTKLWTILLNTDTMLKFFFRRQPTDRDVDTSYDQYRDPYLEQLAAELALQEEEKYAKILKQREKEIE